MLLAGSRVLRVQPFLRQRYPRPRSVYHRLGGRLPGSGRPNDRTDLPSPDIPCRVCGSSAACRGRGDGQQSDERWRILKRSHRSWYSGDYHVSRNYRDYTNGALFGGVYLLRLRRTRVLRQSFKGRAALSRSMLSGLPPMAPQTALAAPSVAAWQPARHLPDGSLRRQAACRDRLPLTVPNAYDRHSLWTETWSMTRLCDASLLRVMSRRSRFIPFGTRQHRFP